MKHSLSEPQSVSILFFPDCIELLLTENCVATIIIHFKSWEGDCVGSSEVVARWKVGKPDLVRCRRAIQSALLDQCFTFLPTHVETTPHVLLSILITPFSHSLLLAWILAEPVTDISAFSSAFFKIHSPPEHISKTYLVMRDSWALWSIADFGVRLVWI